MSRPHADDADRNGKSKLTWILPLVLLGLLAGLYFVWPDYQAFMNEAWDVLSSGEQERVQQWVQGYGTWTGALVILSAMLIQSLLFVLPSVAAMIASVLAYGPWIGGALAWGGLVLAAAMTWAIGRAVGQHTLDRMLGPKTRDRVEAWVEEYGIWAVVLARVSPALSTDAVSFVAGSVKMGFWRFIAATAGGSLPLVVLVAWLGTDMDRLEIGMWVITGISVAALVGYLVWKRVRGQSLTPGGKDDDERDAHRGTATAA